MLMDHFTGCGTARPLPAPLWYAVQVRRRSSSGTQQPEAKPWEETSQPRIRRAALRGRMASVDNRLVHSLNTVLGDPLINASIQGELLTRFDYCPRKSCQSEGDFHRTRATAGRSQVKGWGSFDGFLRRHVGHLLVLGGGHRLDLWCDRNRTGAAAGGAGRAGAFATFVAMEQTTQPVQQLVFAAAGFTAAGRLDCAARRSGATTAAQDRLGHAARVSQPQPQPSNCSLCAKMC